MAIKASSTITLIRVDDGDNGIIIQASAPANPYAGQLWQTASGAPVKRWDGSKWVIWYLDVSNLNVETLAAIAATIGTVSNPYTTGVESEWSNEALTGKITIGGAGIKNEYKQTANAWKGMWRLSPGSYYAELRNQNDVLQSAVSVSPEGYSVYSTRLGNQWLSLSDEMLYDTGWVKQDILKGTGNIYARRWMGRRMIRFENYIWNGSVGNAIKLSGDFLPTYHVFYSAPIWTGAGTSEIFAFNTDGGVFKATNVSGTSPLDCVIEYY